MESIIWQSSWFIELFFDLCHFLVFTSYQLSEQLNAFILWFGFQATHILASECLAPLFCQVMELNFIHRFNVKKSTINITSNLALMAHLAHHLLKELSLSSSCHRFCIRFLTCLDSCQMQFCSLTSIDDLIFLSDDPVFQCISALDLSSSKISTLKFSSS
mgnify:CR=1 FL=1